MINSSLKQLAAALAAKKLSAAELDTLYLDRIEALNPRLNAFITRGCVHEYSNHAAQPEHSTHAAGIA